MMLTLMNVSERYGDYVPATPDDIRELCEVAGWPVPELRERLGEDDEGREIREFVDVATGEVVLREEQYIAPFLTVAEAAAQHGCDPMTVYRALWRGDFPRAQAFGSGTRKLWAIPKKDVVNWKRSPTGRKPAK